MWNNEWIKGEDYPTWGNTDVYKKTISGGYLFDGETPREAYKESLKLLLVDYINQKWQKLSSSTYGMVGFVSLAQYYLIQVLIAVCLLAVSVLTWLIVYNI